MVLISGVGHLEYCSPMQMGPPLNIQVASMAGGLFVAVNAEWFRDVATRLSAFSTKSKSISSPLMEFYVYLLIFLLVSLWKLVFWNSLGYCKGFRSEILCCTDGFCDSCWGTLYLSLGSWGYFSSVWIETIPFMGFS